MQRNGSKKKLSAYWAVISIKSRALCASTQWLTFQATCRWVNILWIGRCCNPRKISILLFERKSWYRLITRFMARCLLMGVPCLGAEQKECFTRPDEWPSLFLEVRQIQVLTAIKCRQNKLCKWIVFLFDDTVSISKDPKGYKTITSGKKIQIWNSIAVFATDTEKDQEIRQDRQ
jgi:hypothetical protein